MLTACTADDPPPPEPVVAPVPLPSLAPDQVAACRALLEALPRELDPGVERRSVGADPGRVAAWGEPAVVLACGVAPPDRPDEPASVNGVVWSVRDSGGGYAWTTTELAVTVVVEVPDAYPNPAELVNPLAGPLQAALSPAP